MKKVLITGAAGFIGFHLANRLHSRGDKVIGLDNFNDYYTPALKKQRAALLKESSIDVIEGDICDEAALNKIVEHHAITHIVHLAAQAGVRYSLTNPAAYLHSNINGFLSILECISKHPSIKLVYASSSSVYGNNTKTPFAVGDPTENQASLYGVTKKANELMAETYQHIHGVAAIGLRFFTVYGPWGRPDMAYYSFTKAILEEREIDVYNYGQMQRDFTYIDDIIDGTVAAMDLVGKHPQRIFNLGNNKPEPLVKLVTTLEQLLGKKAKLRHLPMQPGDVPTTYADIELSQKVLGFNPQTSLDKGLANFTSWYTRHHSQK